MGKTNIVGEYNFRIIKDESGWYIAELKVAGEADVSGLTQGRNEEEIFMMVGDCFSAMMDVRVGWWNKMLARLMIYRKK